MASTGFDPVTSVILVQLPTELWSHRYEARSEIYTRTDLTKENLAVMTISLMGIAAQGWSTVVD